MALFEALKGHHGQRVVRVPAAAFAFDAVGGGAALCFRRAAADMPALFPKLRIVDQVAALGHVVQQLVDRFLFRAAAQAGSQFGELFPRLLVAVVLERVRQRVEPGPGFPGLVIVTVKSASRFLGVITQVPEVQTPGRQIQVLLLGLPIDPDGSVINADRGVGLVQAQTAGIAFHHTTDDFMIAAADRNPAPLLILRVIRILV